MEKLFARIRKEAKATSYARPTAILYWNSMFEFSMYAAHKKMIDLEAAGVGASPAALACVGTTTRRRAR